jgi:ribosomal protein S18 acetylase RimI-like enzyme
VADLRGAPVGQAAATELDGALHLLALRVAPEHRGRGLGGRLLDAVIDHGRWAFHPAVTAVARRDGPAAALLARRGFMALRADALPPGLAARIAEGSGTPGLYALGKRL